jgi:hypothetical protein
MDLDEKLTAANAARAKDMNDRTHSITNVGKAEQDLAAEARRIEQGHRTGVHTGYVTEDDLRRAVENRSGVVSLGGNEIRYAEKEAPRSIQFGADDPVGATTETELDNMARRADFLVEELRQMSGPDGQPRPGFELEHRRAALQLESLKMAAAFQEHIAAPRMRERYNAEAARTAQDLQAEQEALQQRLQRQQDTNSRAFDRVFGPLTIR